MHGVTLLLIGLLNVGAADYSRPLGARKLDQATLDAEGYGEKKAFKREDDGLRITLAPGEKETGWKTPQTLKIGGDFTITANLVIGKLPKPAQEDGAAVGLAIASQSLDQPDLTLVRLIEPNGSDVYRPIERAGNNPMQMQMQMQMQMRRGLMGMMPPMGGKAPKPPRPTFPAAGEKVRIELRREGPVIRFQVVEGDSDRRRYLGQVSLGTNDIAGVKLFASNRNGAEAVNVLLRDLTIRADRINGLGTTVRNVYGEVIYADPTAIEDGVLVLGGPPKSPPPAPLKPQDGKPAAGSNTPANSKAGEASGAKEGPATPKGAEAKPAPAVVAPAPVTVPAVPAVNDTVPAILPPAPAVVRPAPGVNVMGSLPPTVISTPPPGAAPGPPPKPKEKVKIPLDEVESIRFERTPALVARFVGQPNLDFTMPGPGAKKDDGTPAAEPRKADGADDVLAPPPGTTATAVRVAKVEPKKNGIRDLHLALSNLREAAITQVTVTCQTDKGPTSWRIDTSNSQDWPLVIRRSGTEAWADLFLEPPAGDCHQKDFTIGVVYADGQNANATVKATEHTDPKLAVDPKGPAAPSSGAWVYLAGEEKLFGKLERLGEESLRLTTTWGDHLDVPLARVAGIHFGLPDRKESPESFARRLKTRGTEDLLLARTKDGEVVAISGILEGTDGDKLRFLYQDKTRTLPLAQVEGIVMATRPESGVPAAPSQLFSLPGAVVSGRLKDLDTAVWKVETAWGQSLNLPAPEVQGVRFRGGKMTYLSDLEPSKVEETPFFGLRLPWRRDVNLLGEPLKMNGQGFERGLAVHSRCVLTYDLDGQYTTFEALVGFDDTAKGKGRVDLRVFADGKRLHADPDLRADGPPKALSLPVSGARSLKLHVDYGGGQNTGDRVIWANARLHRRPSQAASAATSAPPSVGATEPR